MSTTTLDEALHSYLTDAHSIEQQALAQMKVAPRMAGDPEIAAAFEAHIGETEEQERLVRERLEAHGESPTKVKDAVMGAGGVGFALFARLQPDTPGKLMAHSYSYEHLEVASYGQLALVAERAGDSDTVAVAGHILGQEREMAGRLEALFDRAAEASLREVDPDDLDEQLHKYLADAHALEAQAIELLERAQRAGGDPELERLFAEHLDESREHQRWVEERLGVHAASPSRLQDAAMKLGGLNWSIFFGAHPDTPGKLAAFSYAFEHLEIAGYEQLKHVARRAGDEETVAMADRILAQEHSAAEKLAASFERAVEASLRDQDLPA